MVPIQSDTVPQDRVAGQRPDPGTEADEGSLVTITVSSGPGEAQVPLVQDLPADDAVARLREAGLKSEQRREFSDTVKNGRVIETSPSEGSTVRKGSTVTLVVSRGKEKVDVPDVVGKTREEAERLIRRAELEPAVTEREDADAEPGTVLEQDPEAGTPLAKGRTVELVVAKAPAEVDVPGVIDASEDDAVAALEDAGFEVNVEDAVAETPAEDGIVLEQDPRPDSVAADGLGGHDHRRALRAGRRSRDDARRRRREGRRAARRPLVRARRLARVRRVGLRRHRGGRPRGAARAARARRILARAGRRAAEPRPRRRPARRRRRVSRAARPVRRGRHRAGTARAARRALRRRGRARLVAVHGQGRLQGRARRGRRPQVDYAGGARGALAQRARGGARGAGAARPARVRQAGAARLVGRDRQGERRARARRARSTPRSRTTGS